MTTHNILYSVIRRPLEMTVKDGEQLGASRHSLADFAPSRHRPIHRIVYNDHRCMSLRVAELFRTRATADLLLVSNL